MGKPYIRDEDNQDYEQEKLIQEWLKREGKSFGTEFQYISSKGTARNTLIRGSVSLDQKVGQDDERSGTYADIIAGSDGRDLHSGNESNELTRDPREEIFWNLSALGFNETEALCLVKILKLSLMESN